MKEIYEEAKKRLLNNIKIEGECWVWQKSCFINDGYGQTSLKGKKMRAHRLSYLIFKNEDPGNKYVCHTCDNPKCINPDHLWLGTAKENTQDSVKKERCNFGKGEKCPHSKLTENDVIEIKKMLLKGIYQKDIAKMFKVDQANISYINRGLSWKHIGGDYLIQL